MDFIMVIDDSPTIRSAVELVVKSNGFSNIRLAEDGIDALNKIKEIKSNGDDISLCVTDINMPNMDGICFIKEFRKSDKFTPILVLTTECGSTMIEEGKSLGASGWVVKPFKPEEFMKAMNRLVKQPA
jgi:two-component system, chemotaxis family, chemotaxis protein CheY